MNNLRLVPGAVPAVPLLEGHKPRRGLGRDAGRLPDGLPARGNIRLYNARRPAVRVPCHGGVLCAVLCGQQGGGEEECEGVRGCWGR